jgi:shikimate kinase
VTSGPIFIIGMPGAGKTALVKEVSSTLNIEGIDTDLWIEQSYFKQTGNTLTVSEIYRELGLVKFRNMERLMLQKIPSTSCLVSSGGGLPCFFDNIDIMLAKGTVVWLNTPLEEIEVNAKQHNFDRPTLSTQSNLSLLQELNNLFESRKKFYRRAHFSDNYKGCYEFILKF